MKTCPACNSTSHHRYLRTCLSCGAPLEERMPGESEEVVGVRLGFTRTECDNCGVVFAATKKDCPECGHTNKDGPPEFDPAVERRTVLLSSAIATIKQIEADIDDPPNSTEQIGEIEYLDLYSSAIQDILAAWQNLHQSVGTINFELPSLTERSTLDPSVRTPFWGTHPSPAGVAT